jgi:hypothetical protein
MSIRIATVLCGATLCWTTACDPMDSGDPVSDRNDEGCIDPTGPVPLCPEDETVGDLRDRDTGDDEDTGDGGDTGADTGLDEEEEADLPYNFRVELGDSVLLLDAFLEEGPAPAAILSVEMPDGDWRLAELQAEIPFVVDESDCDHEGNKDIGRDRIWITWMNANGSTDSDHMTIRYCGR